MHALPHSENRAKKAQADLDRQYQEDLKNAAIAEKQAELDQVGGP
jgi:hypothetical protein